MGSALSPELLRIADKRDLWRRLHQQGDQAAVHRLLEDAEFQRLLNAPLPRSIPGSFSKKLTAFGREWERAIAVQGAQDGAQFSEAELHLDPSLVVQFQAVIEERLKRPAPWGVFLFVESAIPLELTKESWRALAYFIHASSTELSQIELATCPGVRQVGAVREVRT